MNPFATRITPDPTKNIHFTAEQLAVIDSTANSIVVNSVAGSGKSSTLLAIAHQYQEPYTGLYLAFNKDIVQDIKPKLPSNWSCKTFHSVGLGIAKQHMPDARVSMYKLKDLGVMYKTQKVMDQHMNANHPNTVEGWNRTIQKFEVETDLDPTNMIKIYNKIIDKNDQISFNDMINYPIINQWKASHYDIILADEFQDLAPNQLALIDLIPHDRIIFVGDRNQQIYTWRSSDKEIYKKIEEKYKPIQYDITQSFRCPNLVLNEARKYVPKIWSDIEGGLVSRPNSIDYSRTEDECFILSRVNAKLIYIARNMIKSKTPFSINHQIIKSLTREINIASNGCTTVKQLVTKLEKQENIVIKKALSRNQSIASRTARFQALYAVIEKSDTIAQVKAFLTNLSVHSTSGSKRKLSTIHAAKGLESKNVYIINESLSKKFIKINIREEKFDAVQEEENLLYVASTRSLNKLIIPRKDYET